VPVEFSASLDQAMQAAGQTVEYYVYNGDNHNLLNNWGTVMRRTIEFFDKHVKGG
jgi:dipeptidyl aminopeptidase/acylaminoacyl peptidase